MVEPGEGEGRLEEEEGGSVSRGGATVVRGAHAGESS